MIVAFDFDGTLAPSFNLVNRCIIQVAKDNGIFLKESDLIPYYGPTEEGMINNILTSDNRANFKKYLQYIHNKKSHKHFFYCSPRRSFLFCGSSAVLCLYL